MAVLVCFISYPTEQTEEVAKRLQEIMPKIPTPEHLTVKGPYWNSDSEKGIQGFLVCEVEASKLNEERLRLAAGCNACHGIPGFKWSVRIWSDQSDIQQRREKYGF